MFIKPLIFFVISFIGIYILTKLIKPIREMMFAFGQYLQIKAFPSDSKYECYKFGILRVFFGAILLLRAYRINSMLILTETNTIIGVYSLIALVSAAFVMTGFLTQWALLILTFLVWQYGEIILNTSTLGNDVAAMLSLLLFLTSAGKFISIDSLIIKKIKWFSPMLLYFKDSTRSEHIALAKFTVLAAYWAICTYSLSIHFNEPAWTSGIAGPLVLTNNFMSSWFEFFQNLFERSPLSVHIARFSIWAMMLWYSAILPLVLIGGIWRKYIIIWGLLFFTLSMFVLNLGSLAEIEFVFWAALFWSNKGINNKDTLLIFYDDKCNLCDKTIQVITVLDFFKQIELKPISTNSEILEKYKISKDRALNDLYGIASLTKKTFFGYDFYVILAARLVLLWPFLPLLYLGKVTNIGYMVYRVIADRRKELFGLCILPRQKTIRPSPIIEDSSQPIFYSIVIHVIFLTSCYLVSIPAPYIGLQNNPTLGSRAAHYYGVAPINVFNITDIRMAQNWYTLFSSEFEEPVPLFTEKGSRLAMHKSDRVYFGNTLLFRRQFIGAEGCFLNANKTSIDYLSKVYLHTKNAIRGTYAFTYRQYFQQLPDMNKVVDGIYFQPSAQIRCSENYEINY
jgi:predicted DCC family thiol-disulfide oxidoreductase YuxK